MAIFCAGTVGIVPPNVAAFAVSAGTNQGFTAVPAVHFTQQQILGFFADPWRLRLLACLASVPQFPRYYLRHAARHLNIPVFVHAGVADILQRFGYAIKRKRLAQVVTKPGGVQRFYNLRFTAASGVHAVNALHDRGGVRIYYKLFVGVHLIAQDTAPAV